MEFLSGALAGTLTRCLIAPIDVIKIRYQLQTTPSASILTTTQQIIAKEGVAALWKGNLSAVYLYFCYGGCQFASYDALRGIVGNGFIAGGMAGCIATIISYPLDVLRTRFAAQGTVRVYDGLLHAFSKIWREEGIVGFYRGVIPSAIQIFPYMGLNFAVFEALKGQVNDGVAGGISGIASKLALYPIDTIRKRLQVQGPTLALYAVETMGLKRMGFVECIKLTIRNEGVFGLYKGILPGLVKAGVSSASIFFVYGTIIRNSKT